ncbi:MAG: hypothetical protein ACQESR_17005 [Planctomycetota bacterium]
MERCPTQAVLPLVGLAAEKVIRDRYSIPVADLFTPASVWHVGKEGSQGVAFWVWLAKSLW